jgi:hypothetical protein
MAKMTSVAKAFTKQFIAETDKRYALNKIVYELNHLVYAGTKDYLSYKDKAAIITYLFDTIAGRRILYLENGAVLTPEFTDVVHFFERRNFILKHLKAGGKEQAQFN